MNERVGETRPSGGVCHGLRDGRLTVTVAGHSLYASRCFLQAYAHVDHLGDNGGFLLRDIDFNPTSLVAIAIV